MKEYHQPVPCGKCPECKAKRASAWSFRLAQELKRSTHAEFITLTYDERHVPYAGDRLTLRKADVQLFFKRLRKRCPQSKIKYYTAGEYGGKTWRPHYHVILFNVANPYDVDKAWQLGSTYHDEVNENTIRYSLKYIDKPRRVPQYKDDPRQPEFGLMSKGLGLNYLTPQVIAWHHADLTERMYIPLQDGITASMPRYFKEKIYTEAQREEIKEHHQKLITEKENALIKKYGGTENLEAARLQVLHYKLAQFKNNQKKEKS